MLFSADTLALPFIYAIILEIVERKEVKRVPESGKYAESAAAAAGCSEEIIPRIPVDKGAETDVYHTPASLQPVRAPWLSLSPPFAGLAPIYASITLQRRADSPRSRGYLAR